MQTSVRVTTENRDALARVADEDLGGVSLDEALRVLIFEHRSRVALKRLGDQPGRLDLYIRGAGELGGVDIEIAE